MQGNKFPLSRRNQNSRNHYLALALGEDEDETGIELQPPSLKSEHDGSFEEGLNRTKEIYKSLDAELRRQEDSIDLSVIISKDLAKGFKRKSFEHRDFVCKFTWFDILISVTSICLYFFDVGTDIKLAVEYFLDSQWFYGSVTTALIVGPSFVTCCFGLHWYYIDYKMEQTIKKNSGKKNPHIASPRVWFCRFFFTALQFGPVVRTIEYLYYGCKSRSSKLRVEERRRFHWWMLYEDVDNCLLRLFECFLESAPQLTWQLYIAIETKPSENVIGTTTRAAALLSSWASLAVCLVSHHCSLRYSNEKKHKMQLRSMPVYFLWRACETGGRVLCISMFASAFGFWVFGILLLHWLVNACWLMSQHTSFYSQRCLEKIFNIICGYVMLFCFLNLREGHTRYRFLIFYIIFYIENFFMLAFWFRFTLDLGAWFHITGFTFVLILFVLHIVFQLLYYICCHPTKSIQYCLPCDGYTFHASACYDIHPEPDDVAPARQIVDIAAAGDAKTRKKKESNPNIEHPQANEGDARMTHNIPLAKTRKKKDPSPEMEHPQANARNKKEPSPDMEHSQATAGDAGMAYNIPLAKTRKKKEPSPDMEHPQASAGDAGMAHNIPLAKTRNKKEPSPEMEHPQASAGDDASARKKKELSPDMEHPQATAGMARKAHNLPIAKTRKKKEPSPETAHSESAGVRKQKGFEKI